MLWLLMIVLGKRVLEAYKGWGQVGREIEIVTVKVTGQDRDRIGSGTGREREEGYRSGQGKRQR